MRKLAYLLVILGAIFAVLALFRPAAAWDRRSLGPRVWGGPSWMWVQPAPSSSALPYGSRFYYPPGTPFSYEEPGSGTTYCLSRPTGFYYVCGYSLAAREPAEPTYRMPPPAPPPFAEQGLPAPSGVLIFRLPQDAEAVVDGAPVGLSQGLGITSVPPGTHRVVVRASGAESERTIAVSPRAIFTVTPTTIIPTGP